MSEECKCCETEGDCINGLCLSCANFVHNLEKHYDKMKEQRDELLKVSEAVMKWWEEHEYDTTGGEEEYNIYDDEPEMVTLARAAIELVKKQV